MEMSMTELATSKERIDNIIDSSPKKYRITSIYGNKNQMNVSIIYKSRFRT